MFLNKKRKKKKGNTCFSFIFLTHGNHSDVKSHYFLQSFPFAFYLVFRSFQRALEILEMNAKYKDDDVNKSRALAFRRGSAVLKSLPFTVTSLEQVRGLPDIGKHCMSVIQVHKAVSTIIPCFATVGFFYWLAHNRLLDSTLCVVKFMTSSIPKLCLHVMTPSPSKVYHCVKVQLSWRENES